MRMLWGAGERGRDPVRTWSLPGHCPLGLLREGETRLDHVAWALSWQWEGQARGAPLILSLDQEHTVPHPWHSVAARYPLSWPWRL